MGRSFRESRVTVLKIFHPYRHVEHFIFGSAISTAIPSRRPLFADFQRADGDAGDGIDVGRPRPAGRRRPSARPIAAFETNAEHIIAAAPSLITRRFHQKLK